jgi:AcrR family transcriptional regulator
MNAASTPVAAGRPQRLSADERRAAIVAAGMDEFATKGLAGASVDAVARRAGVSQPYVYQLFGTKQDLFLAVVQRGFERTRLAFEDAIRRQQAGEFPGCDTALGAMGLQYMELLADRTLLLVQLQAYAACSEPAVRHVVRAEFSALHAYVRDVSHASEEEIHHFFAEGMLLNVGAAIQLGLPGKSMEWTLEPGGAD